MSVTDDPSGTLLLAPVTGFMEQAAGWSVVVQRHHTFTEILQGFICFFSPRSKTTHKTGRSLKMSDKDAAKQGTKPRRAAPELLIGY